MRLHHHSAVAAMLLALGSTCVGAQTRPANATPVLPTRELIDDVVVLAHRADAFDHAPRWSLAPIPLATAGGAESPDYDLTNVRAVEILSDGRIVTLAPVGSRLLVFGPDGRGEKSLGRQGKGPGEIMAPTGLLRTVGDTLIILDPANNRINWLVATKGFVDDRPLPTIRNSFFIRPVGMLRTGELVMSTGGLVQRGVTDSVTRPPASVVLYSSRTGSATVVAALPDLELLRVATNFRGRAGSESMPLLFARSAMAIAWDTVIATGSGEGYRIDLRNATGQIRSSLRVAIGRRPVTKAMRDSAIASALRRLGGSQMERLVDPAESRRIEQTRPFADSLPPYGGWFVSPNRTLWVVDAMVPSDTSGGATAFRQDGAIIGRLTWSNRGSPVAFGDDRVVMREADADDVISLRVFRIRREPR